MWYVVCGRLEAVRKEGERLRRWDDKKRDAGGWKRDDKDGMVKTWMVG